MWIKSSRLIFVLMTSWKISIAYPLICPLPAPANIRTKMDAIKYLSEFGYLEPLFQVVQEGNSSADMFPVLSPLHNNVRQAVHAFQSWHGLKVTGILDKNTFKLMNLPRCGVKDKGLLFDFEPYRKESPNEQFPKNETEYMRPRRSKRFVTINKQGHRQQNHFTYQIAKYSMSGISDSVVDSTIAEAARMWAKVANINFEKKSSGSADIVIRFEKEIHCNGDNFSANANILAHAYYPGTPNAGQIHFNDNKQWTVGSSEGDNLLWTAAHELGHVLGLKHSQNENAIMYFTCVKGFIPKLRLHNDDIEGIQSIFGKNKHQELTNICVDAIVNGNHLEAIDIYKSLRGEHADTFETILRRAFYNNTENFVSVVDFISETDNSERIEGFDILLELMNEGNLIYDNADVFTLGHMVKNDWKLAAGQDKNKLEELKLKFPEIIQRFIWDPFVWIEWKCFNTFRLDSNYNGLTYHRTKNDESSQKWIVEPIPDSGGYYFSFKNNATGRFLFVESYNNSFDEPHLFVKTRANVPEDEIKSSSWRLFLRKDEDDGKDFVIIDNEETEGCLYISTMVFPSTVFSLQNQETKCTKWLIQ